MIHEQAPLQREKNNELEKKLAAITRELDIQASLEKMRDATTRMQVSEDLKEVNFVMLQQMQNSGIAAAVCFIVIMNEANGSLEFTVANSKTQTISLFKGKINDNPVNQKMYDNWKSESKSFVINMHGKELDNYRVYLKKLGVQMDSDSAANQRVFSMASFSKGIMGVASNEPLSPETMHLLERFAQVFDGSYTRFLDLQKAEAQARQAEIELALERVRAKAMGMNQASDMLQVCKVISEQLNWLNVREIRNVQTAIIYESSHSYMNYEYYAKHDKTFITEVDYTKHTVQSAFANQMLKGKGYFISTSLEGEKLKEFIEHQKKGPEFVDSFLFTSASVTWYWYSLGPVALGISTYVPLGENEIELFKRFRNVFELAYRRYLDIEKAEAQAREAEIELALERVRAKTMAMQKPQEFVEVINVIGRQFINLGFDFDWVNFSADGLDVSKAIDIWNFVVVPGLYEGATRLVIPFFDHPVFSKAADSISQYLTSGNEFTEVVLNKKDKDNFLDHLFTNTIYKDLPDEAKASQYNGEVYLTSNVVLKDTWLSIGKYHHTPLTDEQIAILKRLAKAFGQAYTRFLDLQKAEAQVRESQIQLALERVRARTMAMQKSDELSETVFVLFEQFKELGENPDQATIGIINEDEKVIEYWVTMYGQPINKVFRFSIDEPNVTRKIYKAWKENKKSLVIDLSGKALLEFMEYRSGKGGAAINPDEKRRIINVAFFSKGLLNVQSNKERSEESIRLLERFASVFEQTYTRFLDLQKAEAQAREAQIELSLERVRARAMAMQSSADLKEVMKTLFEELRHLDVNLQACLIATFDPVTCDQRSWIIHRKTNEPYSFLISCNEQPFYQEMLKAWKERNANWSYMLEGEAKTKWEKFLFNDTDFKLLPKEVKEEMHKPKKVFFAASYYQYGAIQASSPELLSNACIDILQRFSKVFDSCYTRFLDLKKAESQAREAEIQLALERVRARSLAMHHTSELQEVVNIVAEQLHHINIDINGGVIISINDEVDIDIPLWASAGAVGYLHKIVVPFLDKPVFTHLRDAIKSRNNFLVEEYTPEEKIVFFKHLFKCAPWNTASEESKAELLSREGGYTRSVVVLNFTTIGIINDNGKKFSAEDNAILKRFGNVFEQAYTRFLDLQKAEEQAREAQIEAGLERVRSRAMAMQTSEELAALIGTVFTELTRLDLMLTRCVIWIFNPETNGATWWMANSEDAQNPINCDLPYNPFEPYLVFLEQWQKRANKFQYELSGKIKKDWDNYLFSQTGLSRLPAVVIEGMKAPERVFLTASFNNFGAMNAATLEPLSDEHLDVLLRFAKVFDLTYTRFNDLKQAEAQAREAKIQLALERVRAKTMAMHSSEGVSEVTALMFNEFSKLGIKNMRCGIGVLPEDSDTMEVWGATVTADGHEVKGIGQVGINGHPLWKEMYSDWKLKKESLLYHLQGEDKKAYYRVLMGEERYNAAYLTEDHPDHYCYITYFTDGAIFTFNQTLYNDEQKQILKRFATVFSLTYRRYKDLKKAEAQAREAQIEASLERVRGKAMAMQNAKDVSIAASMVFTELRKLGINPIRCGVGLLNKESRKAQLYSATSSDDGDSLSLIGWVLLSKHPVLKNIYNTWLKNEDYFPELSGEQLKSYYELLLAGLSVSVPDWKSGQKQFGHFLSFSVGCLYAWSDVRYNDEEIKILKRFASVIDLTFRRYIELQLSETTAKEAVKQSALDRIRADIASMRTITDLDRITPLIWNELTILGVPFIRCGVFIMDDEQQQIHTFLSTPEGKGIAAFHLPYNAPGNIAHVITHWQKKEIYTDHWDEEAFKEFADSLVKQGAMKTSEQYLSTMPAGSFNLHFVPFQQGMLYVGNIAPLGEEEIDLLRSIADAFSTAYARYEDFNKLEAAKKQVDNTLTELKQAQQQLVQSEKMASLGELTAGIAHEIQNPLNFVNNFSDVNTELLEELKAERSKPNVERDDNLQNELINDVIENSQKINHHGKRADAIVKGMLQHSRKSSGQKEPTDINSLADEYLRLSYHGLRAKDKSFNATIETDFDKSIGKINVIPQDIGRVLLNLFNNAFYAVNEQKNKNLISKSNQYEPKVSVTTKKLENSVLITVVDNGNGIPQKILDKIFQPFFTTKPTGQGTGLGLSLSYDIIKAHGGEIKVKSEEGKGSEFVIQLPILYKLI